MTKTTTDNKPKHCPSCGAPIVSEICAYCGTPTQLNTAKADMEYPVMKCKAIVLNFWTIFFPLIFAISFGIGGLIPIIITTKFEPLFFLWLMGILFLLIGAVALSLVLRTYYLYFKVKKQGKRIQAIVYGYMNDSVMFNGQPAQIVKLLINTPDGPRFILYKLGSTIKLYGINDKIDILKYENYFML